MAKPGPKPQNVKDRFVGHVDRRGDDECWPWTGRTYSGGHGQFNVVHEDGKWRPVQAHRFAYELWVGPIPDGLQIDHTCHNRDPNCPAGPRCPHRRCVNPRHLEPVTNLENGRRGQVAKLARARQLAITHCVRGHPLPAPNAQGRRVCLECGRIKQAEYRRRHPKPPAPEPTTCRNGHPLEGNRYVGASGESRCRSCQREREQRYLRSLG